MDRADYIRSKGLELKEMWECELKQQLKVDREMRDFFDTCEVRDPMDPRRAFYGGRTNSHCLYYKTKEGEKISYVDVMSLYPWVNKWGLYPVGHPSILTENFERISVGHQPYFGLIFCRVQPPKKLLIPLLPLKSGGKLTFPLCRTCVEGRVQESCTHSPAERSLTGVWCSNEIDKALELGYLVGVIHFSVRMIIIHLCASAHATPCPYLISLGF